ncbi:hydroxyacylglutathione hydrolase [Aquabacterium sp.]|uniref:hydroxyacylglutathione hydrolase n=1 Tax=Aquabacterium sp. TaxID=1872578 RepID=UPI00248A40E1|nr:hydroxyacylglutathione hydrolase [Aquabacterium sp.]MDI1258980.1 hydroxyacylglutathione hydrolase [Aquabacterium sp.]
MNLLALPAFTDNYIWMLHDGQKALVVDPGDSTPVLQAMQSLGLELALILVTHRHLDHVGGLAALRPHLKGPVYGPTNSDIDGVDIKVGEGVYIDFQGLRVDVWDTPGHTADHITYLVRSDLTQPGQPPLLFCGDTLFSAGCGRLYDGTAEQLFQAVSRFSTLPGNTTVCCTHEYTLDNLRFARAVEPHNTDTVAYELDCLNLRQLGKPTLPTTIATEMAINPFMRCAQPQVIASAQQHGAQDSSGSAVFTALRQWKNNFKA